MRWCLAALFVAFSVPALAGDWWDDLTPLKASKFPPPRSLIADYRFGWGMIPAADAHTQFSRAKGNQLQILLTAHTTGAVRALWQLDAQHTARCSSVDLHPISLEQVEKYSRKTKSVKADFESDQVIRVESTDPPGDSPPKPRKFKFPGVFDLQTALLMIRSQRLQNGDRYVLVVYPGRGAYLAKVDVVGHEPLKVAGQTYPAVKMKISLGYIDKELKLEPHDKFKSASAWLSDDKDRLLLKVESEVFVGSVWMELQSVKFTDG